MEMPPGTSLDATTQAAQQVEQAIGQRADVAATVTNVGQILGGFGSIPQQGTQYAQINLRLMDKASLLDRLRARPGAAANENRIRPSPRNCASSCSRCARHRAAR